MSWICINCGTYNEESDTLCIACDEPRPAAEIRTERPSVSVGDGVSPTAAPITRERPFSHGSTSAYVPRRRFHSERKQKTTRIVCLCLIALAFVVGQAITFANYFANGTVIALSEFVNLSESPTLSVVAFLVVIAALAGITGILVADNVKLLIARGKYARAWWNTIIFFLAITAVPSVTTGIMFVSSVIFSIIQKRK